ncbi:MAG: DUF2147 domain-containing protein, partial [Bacteroidales bacterium]|nr:DUF2147 domain-containing protein [Bacteroidales bacterium]
MKKIAIFCFLSIYSLAAMAQNADKISGIWWNEEKTTKIEVKLVDGKYNGTIIYMIPEKYENGQEPKDDNNPDTALQSRSLIGLTILEGFVYNAKKDEWKDGTIYDPASGKTYDCFARLEND